MLLPRDLVHLVMTFVQGKSTSEAILLCLQHYSKCAEEYNAFLPDFQYQLMLTDGFGRRVARRMEIIMHTGSHRVEVFGMNVILVNFALEVNQM